MNSKFKGRQKMMHSSRIYFYNDDKYVPASYVKLLNRLDLPRLELDPMQGSKFDKGNEFI